MSFTEDLLNGLGAYLAEDELLHFRVSGNYLPTEWGIYPIIAPANTRCIVLRPYYSSSEFALSDTIVSIQIEYRGGKAEVIRAMDAVFDRLQGFTSGKIGSVDVQTISHTPGTFLGLDEAGNYRHTDNYDLAVHRPSTHRQ